MKTDFNYILFDWDGCLADTLPIWFESMKAGLRSFDLDISDDIVIKGFKSWDFFSELGIPDMDLYIKRVYENVAASLNGIELNDGVENLLSKIKKHGKTAAIVTSTISSHVLPVLERIKVEKYFAFIVSRYDVKNRKPDPEPVITALNRINGIKSESIMIGDSHVDIEAGRNSGISTGWYTSKSNRIYQAHIDPKEIEPDYTFNHMDEVLEILDI